MLVPTPPERPGQGYGSWPVLLAVMICSPFWVSHSRRIRHAGLSFTGGGGLLVVSSGKRGSTYPASACNALTLLVVQVAAAVRIS